MLCFVRECLKLDSRIVTEQVASAVRHLPCIPVGCELPKLKFSPVPSDACRNKISKWASAAYFDVYSRSHNAILLAYRSVINNAWTWYSVGKCLVIYSSLLTEKVGAVTQWRRHKCWRCAYFFSVLIKSWEFRGYNTTETCCDSVRSGQQVFSAIPVVINFLLSQGQLSQCLLSVRCNEEMISILCTDCKV